MRILSIATLFPNPVRPGFGIFVGNQMRAVTARGHVDLVVVSPIGVPPWPLALKPPYRALRKVPAQADTVGLVVHYPRFRLFPRLGGDSNPRRIADAVLPLARRLHGEVPFDLVDAQFFFPDGPAAAIIARELGLPLTIKSRGADIHYWGARPRALKQMLAAAEQAAGLLAVSHALRRDMIALGMVADKIVVHYTGLDHERFHPFDRYAARGMLSSLPGMAGYDQGPLLITPGALIARKGQRLAIAALARLPGVHLALAGVGQDEAALRSHARQHGVGDRVHFLGQLGHDVLPRLFCAADALVLPSASEGLANVWIEALACGTPLVIPDIGGAREIVTDRTAGRIAERAPDAIALAVQSILADPPDRHTVAAHADRFSWAINAQSLVRFWADRLARRQAEI